jgi:hypothetical protein
MKARDRGERSDAVSLVRQRQRIGLLTGLLASAALTFSCAAKRHIGIEATDDELLRTLATLARQGTDALCDPRLLEQHLAIRIGKLESFSSPNVLASERTESISSLDDNLVIARAMYWRFRSAYRSTCSLEIRFRDSRLCETDSARVQALVGEQVEYGPPIPGGVVHGHGYLFKPRSGSSSSLSLGLSDKRCANGFEISAEGEWK